MFGIIKTILLRTIKKNPDKKILIIENQFQTLEFLNRVLGGKYLIVIAEDKEDALLKATMEKPDLIVLKSKLNKEITTGLCASLRELKETSNTPVLIIASKGDDSKTAEFYAQKIDGYLIEPFTKQEILNQIQLALNERK